MIKNRFTKATSILTAVVVLLCLCQGGWTVMFKGFIDFPCFVDYDQANGCIMADEYYQEVDEEKRIQVFLDVGRLGFGGAGCRAESSSVDLLEFETPASSFRFERDDELLYMNGRELNTGDRFTFTNYWTVNPWTVERIEFTNFGAAPVCGSDKPPQIYVIGQYGDQISLIKASLSLAFCLGVVFLATSRKKSDDSPKAG